MRGTPSIVAGLLVCVGFLGCAPSSAPTDSIGASIQPDIMPLRRELGANGHNILLVLSDTHRVDFVSPAYAGADRPTPNLQILAAQGVTFSNALTPVPISAPSYASLMTGLTPSEHGLLNNKQDLALDFPLLQESLREIGYSTGAVVSNPACSADHGFARGFDEFWDEILGRGTAGNHVTDAAIEWLEQRSAQQPFFLFAAYMDAHPPYLGETTPPNLLISHESRPTRLLHAVNPYVTQEVPLVLPPGTSNVTLSYLGPDGLAKPPKGLSPITITKLRLTRKGVSKRLLSGWEPYTEPRLHYAMSNEATLEITNATGRPVNTTLKFSAHELTPSNRVPGEYFAGVRSFDRHFGRLLAYLEKSDLLPVTTIIFVSDHGDLLGEHDAWGHVDHLYEETLRIPLIIKAAGIPAGTRYPAPFEVQELHDLILDLATGEGPGSDRFPFPSKDIGPYQIAATYPPQAEELLVSVRGPNLKLLSNGTDRWELYEPESDPGEQINLWEQRKGAPEVREMRRHLEQELKRIAGVETLDLDSLAPEELEELRALGYLN